MFCNSIKLQYILTFSLSDLPLLTFSKVYLEFDIEVLFDTVNKFDCKIFSL